MKCTISITFLIFFSFTCLAQDFKPQFDAALSENDTLKQRQILEKWESEDPGNAELFTSYFNYYFSKAQHEVVSLNTGEPNGEGFSIQDSAGNTVGFMSGQTAYHPALIKKAFESIDQGIILYPKRLDMRFGKIYVLSKIEEWDAFTQELIKTIQYSQSIDNKWTWTNNEVKENGEEFFLSSLQGYQLDLYNTGDDDLLINMQEIALKILEYYPEHIESLSNLAITYLLTEEYDKGLEALLKAEKLNPEDFIVVGNIAHAYKLNGDIDKAKEYYTKMIEMGDPQSVAFAKQQLEALKKE